MKSLSKWLVSAISGYALLLSVFPGMAQTEWLEPDCDARLPLIIKGDLFARTNPEYHLILNFNDVLGSDRALADKSLKLYEAGATRPVDLRLAQDTDLIYPSGNPELRLVWTGSAQKPFEEKRLYIYFKTVKPGAPDAWRPLEQKFSSMDPAVVFSTSFEDPDPKTPDQPRDILPVGRDEKGQTTERVWTDKTARTGKYSVKIARKIEPDSAPNSNLPFWFISPRKIEVREGARYLVGVWIKTTRIPRNCHAVIDLQYYDEQDRRLSENGYVKESGPMAVSDWTYVHCSIVAPPGARRASVSFCLAAGDGEVFFDDLTVRAVPGSEISDPEIVPGLIDEKAAKPEQLPRKIIRCGVAKPPPKLDGLLDDQCWATAGKVDDFYLFLKGADMKAVRKTTVYACADEEALYLGFDCEEPHPEKIVARGEGRDGNIWNDDDVEMFLDPDRDERSFYQVAFNAKGTLVDQDFGLPELPGEAWNGPVEVKTHIGKDRWTAEMKLAFTGLRLADAAGRNWTANFARSVMTDGGPTYYSWAKVNKNFGEPETFGEIVLPFDPTLNAVTASPLLSGKVFYGEGLFPVALRSNRGEPVRVKLVISAVATNGTPKVGEGIFTLAPKSQTRVQVPCRFNESNPVQLRFELNEEPGGRPLYMTSGAYLVKPPLQVDSDSTISYLADGKYLFKWALGLDAALLKEAKIELKLVSGDTVQRAQEIPPRAESGAEFIDVGKLPAGSYILKAALAVGGREIACRELAFRRISGPFDH